MANLMHRFLRSKSCLTPIQRLAPSLITQKKSCISNIGSVFQKPEPVSFADPVISLSGNESDQSMRFYPSFSMNYFLNPNMIQCPDLSETASLDEKEEKKKKEEVVIYADSVKKKRKKKMNKHKYRKLRKRLGRKT